MNCDTLQQLEDNAHRTACQLEPQVRAFIGRVYGYLSPQMDEFTYQYASSSGVRRAQLCVEWLRLRTQAENNGVGR